MKFLEKLLNTGNHYVHTEADAFRLRMFNAGSLFATFICIFCVFVFWSNGIYYLPLDLVASFGSLFCLAIIYLNHKGYLVFAGVYVNILAIGLISAGCIFMDTDVNLEILFLAFSFLSFFLLHKNSALKIGFCLVYIFIYLLLSIYDSKVQMDWTPEQEWAAFLTTRAISAFALILFAIFAYRFNELRLEELQKREQLLMNAKEELEKSNRLKSAFLANMSHEIRTPMNSILGFSQILTQKQLPPEESELVGIIHEGSKQLLAIVNDVLDISKIETGEIKLEENVVDVTHLMETLHALFEQKAKEKGLYFEHIFINGETSVHIQTDAQKLRQILSNLLNNALKFTESGSVIALINIISDKKLIEFIIRDTGVGISDMDQKYVFDRFHQVGHTSAEVMKGTGLGLAISKSFAELMGGELSLHSKLGKGSAFKLSIPYQSAKAKLVESVIPNQQVITKTGKILLAEDVYFNRLLVQKLLADSTVDLHCVENGKLAVDFALQNPDLDLILMDVQMPILDGEKAMKIIKNTYPELPIIALTAFGMNEEKTALLNEGFDAFLSKPIKREEFIHTIEQFLSSQVEV